MSHVVPGCQLSGPTNPRFVTLYWRSELVAWCVVLYGCRCCCDNPLCRVQDIEALNNMCVVLYITCQRVVIDIHWNFLAIELVLMLYKLYEALRQKRSTSRKSLWCMFTEMQKFTPVLYIFYRDGALLFIPYVDLRLHFSSTTQEYTLQYFWYGRGLASFYTDIQFSDNGGSFQC